MDETSAKSLANRMQISIDSVVREEYEILLLKELFEGEFGASLVFKGGTALRLVYGSPRFSEDLDFTGIAKIEYASFAPFLERVEKRYPGIVEIEAREKFHTLFALVKIKEDFLSRAMTIKIEISKRKRFLKKEKDYTDTLINSPVTPLTVLARVATLERILLEKEDALQNRKAARDVFDYWYIQQRLGRGDAKPDLKGFSKIQVKDELHRLLPRNYWRLVDPWLE